MNGGVKFDDRVSAAQRLLDETPFGPHWGFAVVDVAPDRSVVELPAKSELYRPGGVLQGGCAMVLADVAFWLAIIEGNRANVDAVTLEMKTNFLRGASSTLRCEARVIRLGGLVQFGDASTFDAEESLVAHHTLTYLLPPNGVPVGSGQDPTLQVRRGRSWPSVGWVV